MFHFSFGKFLQFSELLGRFWQDLARFGRSFAKGFAEGRAFSAICKIHGKIHLKRAFPLLLPLPSPSHQFTSLPLLTSPQFTSHRLITCQFTSHQCTSHQCTPYWFTSRPCTLHQCTSHQFTFVSSLRVSSSLFSSTR